MQVELLLLFRAIYEFELSFIMKENSSETLLKWGQFNDEIISEKSPLTVKKIFSLLVITNK